MEVAFVWFIKFGIRVDDLASEGSAMTEHFVYRLLPPLLLVDRRVDCHHNSGVFRGADEAGNQQREPSEQPEVVESKVEYRPDQSLIDHLEPGHRSSFNILEYTLTNNNNMSLFTN